MSKKLQMTFHGPVYAGLALGLGIWMGLGLGLGLGWGLVIFLGL